MPPKKPTLPPRLSSIITGFEHFEEQEAKPRRFKGIILSFLIPFFAVILIAAVVLLIVLPPATRPADLSLDFTAITELRVDGDPVLQPNYKVMPGDQIQCVFKLETLPNEETQNVNNDVFLRFKANVMCENNYYPGIIDMEFSNELEWFEGQDGFFYYQKNGTSDGLLSVGEKIEILRNIVIDKSIGNEFAGKRIVIQFHAEVLQAQYQAIEEIWPTAPVGWASQYKDLYW